MARRFGLTTAAIALVACTVAFALPLRARGAGLACGTRVDTSVTLRNDLGPCSAGGLVITADGVTVDLNGHRIFGSTSVGDQAGVVFDRTVRSTVKNGTITGFDAGVVIDGGSQNAVKRIKAFANVGGPELGDGIIVMGSDANLIKKNDVFANGPLSGISVFAPRTDPSDLTSSRRPSSGNKIVKNNVHDNNIVFGTNDMADAGIRLEAATSRTSVKRNRIAYNGIDGVVIFGESNENIVSGNRIARNGHHDRPHRLGDGVRIFGSSRRGDNMVAENVVKRNAGDGVAVGSGGFGNVIKRNEARGNGGAGFSGPSASCLANRWLRNTGRGFQPTCTRGR